MSPPSHQMKMRRSAPLGASNPTHKARARSRGLFYPIATNCRRVTGLANLVSETGIFEVKSSVKAMMSVCCIESAGGMAFAFCRCLGACP